MSTEPYPEVTGDESAIVPPQSVRSPEWPKKIRTLTATELDRLTIDSAGRFYWDNKLVNYDCRTVRQTTSRSLLRTPSARRWTSSTAPSMTSATTILLNRSRAPSFQGQSDPPSTAAARRQSISMTADSLSTSSTMRNWKPRSLRSVAPSGFALRCHAGSLLAW